MEAAMVEAVEIEVAAAGELVVKRVKAIKERAFFVLEHEDGSECPDILTAAQAASRTPMGTPVIFLGDCAPPEKKRRTRGSDSDSDEGEGGSDEDTGGEDEGEGGSDSDPGGDCSSEGFEGGSDENTGDEDTGDEDGLLYSLALARSVMHGFRCDMRHEWVPYFETEGERAGVRAAGREWVCLALNRILDPDDITTVSSVPPMTDEFEACVEETMDFNPEDYSKCRYRLQCTFARLVDRNNRYLDAMVAVFNDIVDHIPLKFLVE
jgi:hypothetical protein